jgi:hypothetical protein
MSELNPFGPDHDQDVTLVALPFKFKLLPTHKELDVADAAIPMGTSVLIIIAGVCAVIVPQTFTALSVYTPAFSVPTCVISGFCVVELNPSGPDQLQLVALVTVPNNCKSPSMHNDADAAEADTDGARELFTVILPVTAVVVPHALIALRVYMPDCAVVLILTNAGFCVVPYPFGPLQLQFVALVAVPVNVRTLPKQGAVDDSEAFAEVGTPALIVTGAVIAVVVPQPLMALNV